jgi:hypothetical protein
MSLRFIACHRDPADHFATFAQCLENVVIYASDPAMIRFRERAVLVDVPFFTDGMSPQAEDVLAMQIAKTCISASVAITGLRHPFDIKVQRALAEHAPLVRRLAYYDHLDPYVSEVGVQVMQAAQGVLFANSHLAKTPLFQMPGTEIDFKDLKKVGIGYYPTQAAERIQQRRSFEQRSIRRRLFTTHRLIDSGQKLLVYFGSNHEAYFSKALPAFLALLAEGSLPNTVILIQSHPDAIDRETEMIKAWKPAPTVVFSRFSVEEAQIAADGALYSQTPIAPHLVLAGIPTVQVGGPSCEDFLVKRNLIPSVTTREQCIRAIHLPQSVLPAKILEGLGISTHWRQILKKELSTPPQGK